MISAGRNRGKPKAVGITASGTRAHPGTLAADTRYYPMGTVIYIPGYGYGVVEDRGGDIKGRHRLDLFYNTHKEALNGAARSSKWWFSPRGPPSCPKTPRRRDNAPSRIGIGFVGSSIPIPLPTPMRAMVLDIGY